jgi:hypothetical protein
MPGRRSHHTEHPLRVKFRLLINKLPVQYLEAAERLIRDKDDMAEPEWPDFDEEVESGPPLMDTPVLPEVAVRPAAAAGQAARADQRLEPDLRLSMLHRVNELDDVQLENTLYQVESLLAEDLDGYVRVEEEQQELWGLVLLAFRIEQKGRRGGSLYPEVSELLEARFLAPLIRSGEIPANLRGLVADVLERKRVRRSGPKHASLDRLIAQAYLAHRVVRLQAAIKRAKERGAAFRDPYLEARERVAEKYRRVSADDLDSWCLPRGRDPNSIYREQLRDAVRHTLWFRAWAAVTAAALKK